MGYDLVLGSITATIKNLNFVNAGFSTDKTGSSYTFNECTFDGEETYLYPIKIKGAKAINVNNCTVKVFFTKIACS